MITIRRVTRNINTAILTLSLWISTAEQLSAQENCISVLLPPPSSAYAAILNDIKEGINETADREIKYLNISPDSNTDNLESTICDRVIGIGNPGMTMAEKMNRKSVSGAVFIPPGEPVGHNVYSLIPNPDSLFERLQFFNQGIKKVVVLYSFKYSEKLIHKAKISAKQRGIELIPLESSSLRDSQRLYQQFFASTDDTTALWVLQDPLTIDNNIILTFILEQSWNKNIILFSSQASLAKHGALFSVYPDNVNLGKQLYKAVTEEPFLNQKEVRLLSSMKTAFNTRTASHLGIRYKRGKYVDQTFPK